MNIKNKLARLIIVFSFCTNSLKIDEKISYYLGDDISRETIDIIIKYNKRGSIGKNNLNLFLSEIKNSEILKIKEESYLTNHPYLTGKSVIVGIGISIGNKYNRNSILRSDNLMWMISNFFNSHKYKFRELRLQSIKDKLNEHKK